MKNKLSILIGTMAIMAGCGTGQTPKLGKDPVDKVIAAMTLEEKARVLIGTGQPGISTDTDLNMDSLIRECRNMVPGAAGTTFPIDRLGIPAVVLTDGPAGVRIDAHREGSDETYYCTHFPIATLLSATWDQDLVEKVGAAIGNEVLEYGADVLLAPALNIHRHPLCGRNFEYFSEDPVVSGKIAAAYIRGVQSQGVGTSIKHFAANNQETNRLSCNTIASQRALREIYLKGFEIAIKEAEPWTVMSAYNYVNGTYASENHDLLTTILRDEWGFDGMVMTDWGAGSDPAAQVYAGNDMFQPGTDRQFQAIVEGVRKGEIDEDVLDRNVRRVLEMILKTGDFNGKECSGKPDLAANAKVTRQSATEGMVLLKNDGQTLPFSKETSTLALFGSISYNFYAGGTGSGNVVRAYTVSLLDGLENAGYRTEPALHKAYKTFVEKEIARVSPEKEDAFTALMPREQIKEMPLTRKQIEDAAEVSDAALITIGRPSGEFADRKSSEFYISEDEKKLIEDVSDVFRSKRKKTVVILNIGGVIETASWKDSPDAILCVWQAGQEGGNSVADVLSGNATPSGKLPMTFPVDMYDHGSALNFPIDSDMPLSFTPDKSGRTDRKNIDYVIYEEGIYVGYRWFDKKGLKVSYPFGHGLSYTEFDYSDAQIESGKNETDITVTIKNTGSYKGKEVVQLYVSAPEGKLGKPVKELKAFIKTEELQPGESETVKLTVRHDDLASFDEDEGAWITDKGTYTFHIGASSADIKASLSCEIAGRSRKVNNVLDPESPVNELIP